jgi:hypothetical protein
MDQLNEIVSKFVLCVLLTQLGKTFVAIEKILSEITQDGLLGRSIHIIFTMNTLLSNKQFAKRLESIEQEHGKGSVCVFSSKYTGPYLHVKDEVTLRGHCFDVDTKIRIIVACGHTTRYADGMNFLKALNRNNTAVSRAFVYYDELHKYINDTLRSQIEQIHDLNIVKGITAMTATPDKIYQEAGFWSKIKLIRLADFSDADYAGAGDMIFNRVDDLSKTSPATAKQADEYTLEFIRHVLDKNPKILGENTRTFMPAHSRRASHDSVRELIFSINSNSVVVVINGVEKTLEYTGSDGERQTMRLDSTNEEVSETIPRLISSKGLQNRPLVITGYLCVGMGQTLTHKSVGSFTSAIFGHLDLTNDDIYQLFGRITGRMKNWGVDKYIQTQVYCPKIIEDRCIVMEKCARNMFGELNGQAVTQEDYRKPMFDMGEQGQSTVANIRGPKDKTDKQLALAAISDVDSGVKTFEVFGGNDKEQWKSAEEFYYETHDKKLSGQSRPKKDKDGWYLCSDSDGSSRQEIAFIETIKTEKWSNRFALTSDGLNYARVFVLYNSTNKEEDKQKYTIAVKYARIKDTPSNKKNLKICSKKTKKDDSAEV